MIRYEDSQRAHSQGVTFEFETHKTVISFDDGKVECVHELESTQYLEFLAYINQPAAESIEDGVRAAVELESYQLLNEAVHKLAKTVFTWGSYN